MNNSDLGRSVSDEMDLDEACVSTRGDVLHIEAGVGLVAGNQSMEEATANDEMLARQLAAEEQYHANTHHHTESVASSSSSSSTISEINESAFPHTEYFSRGEGKIPLEVSWDEFAAPAEVPMDADTRFAIRRIVAEVAKDRGHEIAWITKVHLRGRITNSVFSNIETRQLYYAEHIEASFGYKVEDSEDLAPGAMPHESAVIYFGPEDEMDLDQIGLWRKSGGPAVVWDLGEMDGEGGVSVV
ncbi:hypothetical protein DL98DRAFT_591684 [Cadophora sp. DSE1049]|nr:hypothetical protein DL98DRAFT_591684 [Cadophora sp. DSE1049]